MVEAALRGDLVEVGFALELVEQAGSVDARHLEDELELLLDHPEEEVRLRVLRLLARFSPLGSEEKIWSRLEDQSERVGEAAVGALVARRTGEATVESLLEELLGSTAPPIRRAALSWLLTNERDEVVARAVGSRHLGRVLPAVGSEDELSRAIAASSVPTRREAALALGLSEAGPMVSLALGQLMSDPEPEVAADAVRSSGLVGSLDLANELISKLGEPSLRAHAKEALLASGRNIVELCEAKLVDVREELSVRRTLPWVLARIEDPRATEVLQAVVGDERVPRSIRYQAIKALNRLRSTGDAEVSFDQPVVLSAVGAEVADAHRYVMVGRALEAAAPHAGSQDGLALLRSAVGEAWHDRGEATFRLLGLVFPPDEMYRSHVAVTRSDDRRSANAVEWLEGTLGHGLFNLVLPVLPTAWQGESGEHEDLAKVLEDLGADPDPWVSSVAAWGRASGGRASVTEAEEALDVIEKVFLLQKVDLLQGARSSHLGLLATIAEEVDVDAGQTLLRTGEPNEARRGRGSNRSGCCRLHDAGNGWRFLPEGGASTPTRGDPPSPDWICGQGERDSGDQ